MNQKFNQNYYFGSIYSDYDTFLNWENVATDILEHFTFTSFLDVGCGCGNLVRAIRNQRPGIDAHGVDISKFAVKKANAPFVQLANCTKLPFADKQFDLIYILGTFSYLSSEKEMQNAISEAYRVCNRLIVFEDVYKIPQKNSDDFDPFRCQVFTKKTWACLWKQFIGHEKINTCLFQGKERLYDIIEIHQTA